MINDIKESKRQNMKKNQKQQALFTTQTQCLSIIFWKN